ncbi:DUF916 and DUF3324 domain-containing protein [Macrococcus bovicus]|uniref:DUF916 and DUF3324 domain-containing protein n=1 Tax=Macrococcus bovicus TaxID=69968 RepID=UPI0025A66F5A|nr:DUF916 and DUF3324 domain-containing protein [Macrococcus bovicus]WJP98496.1 DUF916 and DUF3324 domain-containing protein [Macrococcus bovicus]
MRKLLTILLLLTSINVYRADAADNQVPFSVEPILPANQNSDVSGYYDINLKPGAAQVLQAKLFNPTDRPITIEVSANRAATNNNGLIVYDGSEKVSDLGQVATVQEKSITLQAGETKVTDVKIKMPSDFKKGEILGGLYFLQRPEKNDDNQAMLTNNYAYAIAVRLHRENKQAVKPALSLDKVTPELINYRTGIDTKYVNAAPVTLTKMKFHAEVLKKNGTEALYTSDIEDFAIAPDAPFNVPLMFDNKPLEPGEYVYRSSFTKGKEKYEFEKAFTITAEQADKINGEAVELDKSSNWWMYAIGILLLIIAGLVYYVVRLNKKVKE